MHKVDSDIVVLSQEGSGDGIQGGITAKECIRQAFVNRDVELQGPEIVAPSLEVELLVGKEQSGKPPLLHRCYAEKEVQPSWFCRRRHGELIDEVTELAWQVEEAEGPCVPGA